MNPKEHILQETFDAGLKRSLYANFKKWTEAFLELADNSVSNRLPGKLLTVEIGTSPKHLRILNKGGAGMKISDLQGFLEWGKIKARTPYDIGSYSQGGKAAMGYLGSSMKVIASPHGSTSGFAIEDDDLHDYRLKKYSARETPTKTSDGFVEVEVRGLRRSIKAEELEELVTETYRPLVENKDIKITHNGVELSVRPYPLDKEFPVQRFEFEVKNGNEQGKKVIGWIGRLIPRSGVKGGMRCYKLGRLIVDREFFGHPDANYKQTLNFLFGEVHLDHVTATTNKTDFDRDSKEWEEVEQEMFAILKPHIDDLLGREIQEPTDEEKDRVERAKRVVEELLKMRKLDIAGAALNDEALGQAKKESMGGENTTERQEPKRENNPATPPPSGSVGKRRRLKEFMDWDIRPMDESVRSKIEEGEGKRLLVINNLFPGFREAKGNLLYLLETAAIQLTSPDTEEKISPQEYIEKFDELYAFFCNNLGVAKEKLNKKKMA